AADKIAHCSNVIAQSSNVSALVTAHNTRGLALMDAGRFGEAVDDFTFVIRHEPQIAGFYDNRQNAYRRSGRLDDALKDANEAIRLAPTYSFVFRGRAREELEHMPGSLTTPGRNRPRGFATVRIAFRPWNAVGARDDKSFAAQWLAYASPCRRFAADLAVDSARLGAGAVRETFTVEDFHLMLLAGLPAHSKV